MAMVLASLKRANMMLLLLSALGVSTESASAEITKEAYIALWARTCKMGIVTREISLPPDELALMAPELDSMKQLGAALYGYYGGKKAFGAQMPPYPVFVEQQCQCIAEYITARRSELGKGTGATLFGDARKKCLGF